MHVELTSRCVLSCPGCPRTDVIQRLGSFPKQDLDMDQFIQFMDTPSGRAVPKFLLEGNHGDPIYAPQLMDFLDTFREHKSYVIVTNGSHRDQAFWDRLAQRLTAQDRIIFSIDGLPENNHLYRRNTDWPSIELALRTLKDHPVQVTWKTIVFNYNHDQLDQIQELAHSFGADFLSQITSRFGDDSLRPPEHLVEHRREYTPDTERVEKLKPQCEAHATEYVSADGYYWPCCWISSAFTLYKSDLWRQRDQWRIQGRNLDQMRATLADWIGPMQARPDVVCRMLCRPENPPFDSVLGD